MQKNLEYGFDFWLLHKTFNKKSLSQKVKEGAFDNFQSMYVCTFNKMCVSQSLNILRKLNIENYITLAFYFMIWQYTYFSAARNIRPFDMDGNLYQDQAKIE